MGQAVVFLKQDPAQFIENPLTTLEKRHTELDLNPERWMPWNYLGRSE